MTACLYFDTTAGIVITVREGCRRWVCDCCENQQHQHIWPQASITQENLCFWYDLLQLLTMVSSLKDMNSVLISAGPNSYTGQVRFYSKKQLKSVFANTLSSNGQVFFSLLINIHFSVIHVWWWFEVLRSVTYTSVILELSAAFEHVYKSCFLIWTVSERVPTRQQSLHTYEEDALGCFFRERSCVVLGKECWRTPGQAVMQPSWHRVRRAQGRATWQWSVVVQAEAWHLLCAKSSSKSHNTGKRTSNMGFPQSVIYFQDLSRLYCKGHCYFQIGKNSCSIYSVSKSTRHSESYKIVLNKMLMY